MTNYRMISTNDLMNSWNRYSGVVVYLDKPHQIQSITQDKQDVTVVTDLDTFVIPRADKQNRMWRILDV